MEAGGRGGGPGGGAARRGPRWSRAGQAVRGRSGGPLTLRSQVRRRSRTSSGRALTSSTMTASSTRVWVTTTSGARS
ncbi:hypothetical protein ACFFX0_02585 [Citricoccus parietis]|uniref:Uncharacterized protein n=1 Tax=Citricoccus parietis TaxID=592307 RepID=A0ABV5FTX7_9MICC